MRRKHDDAHGLTSREQHVVDLLEAGVERDAIATDLGLGRGTIDTLARRYIIGIKQLNEFATGARAGDARYRAALAASEGMYR